MSKDLTPKQNQNIRRHTRADSDTVESASSAHPLITLGQQLGNAHVARMLTQREAVAPDDDKDKDEVALSREAPEVGLEGGPVSDATAGRINSMRGGGSALDDGTRAQMEGALGDDFSDVRVHTGGEAAQLNRSLGARAFTTGTDVFFGAGASPGDKSLLAHELTHVSQQRGMGGGERMTVGAADDPYEHEAESTAAAVSSGAAPAVQPKREDEAA